MASRHLVVAAPPEHVQQVIAAVLARMGVSIGIQYAGYVEGREPLYWTKIKVRINRFDGGRTSVFINVDTTIWIVLLVVMGVVSLVSGLVSLYTMPSSRDLLLVILDAAKRNSLTEALLILEAYNHVAMGAAMMFVLSAIAFVYVLAILYAARKIADMVAGLIQLYYETLPRTPQA